MKMKNRYVFPAIFSFDPDGISVEFPDLPGCLTCGNTLEDALYMARDALELHLYGMERDNDNIPEPSLLTDVNTEDNQRLVLVEVWMPPVRDEMMNRSVKKTLTIPQWLNDMAEQRKVNFSQILQAALKDHLGVNEPSYLKK